MSGFIRSYGPITTATTTDSLDRMWDVLLRRRDGTKRVSVEVHDLLALLKDHAAFCDVVKTSS